MRLLLLCIAIPVAFVALGAWQMHRSLATAASFGREAANLQQNAERLAVVAARDPMRIVQFQGASGAYAAPLAVQMMQDGVRVLRREAIVACVQQGIAGGTMAASLLALLGCGIGLVVASRVKRTGLRSRAALVASFTRIQRILPGLLGSVAVGTLMTVSCAVLFETLGVWYLDDSNGIEVRLVIVALAIAGAAASLAAVTLQRLFRVIAAFAPGPKSVLGRRVLRQDAPGLWSLVDGLARDQGAMPPDNIVVGLTDGFFVTAFDVALWPHAAQLTGRSLHVPLPYLAMLSRAESTVIICHELAHFAGEDTAYSQRFLPVYAGIEQSLSRISDGRRLSGKGASALGLYPATALGLQMMEVFDTSVKHWSRVREFAADAASIQQAGAAAAGTALIRTGGIAAVVDGVLDETAQRPADAPGDLVAAMVERAEQDGFGDPASRLEDCQPHPTDTHPPTLQRIKAVGLAADEALLAAAVRPVADQDAAFAAGLFADWPGLCAGLSADAVAVATERDRAWEQALKTAAAAAPEASETAVYEDIRRPLWFMGLYAAGLAGVALFLFYVLAEWTLAEPSGFSTVLLAACGLLLAALVFAGFGLARFASRRAPFLILGTDGFTCRGLDRPVPWTGVDRVSVVGGSTFITGFDLSDTTPLPKRVSGWRARVRERRRRVTLIGLRPLGLTPQAYLELLLAYRSAAVARRALDLRQTAPYTMVLSEDELQAMLKDDTSAAET